MSSESADAVAAQEWYDRKSALMQDILGHEHDMVMHAIIPYWTANLSPRQFFDYFAATSSLGDMS